MAQAQEPLPPDNARRMAQALRLDDGERITLDGQLDEPIWTRALPANDFIQIDPNNGAKATEPTEVRIVFSRDALYLGVTAYDSEPDRWLGYQRRRDEFLSADDRFMWTIDTYLDARSGYFFEMNPSGLMADSIFGVNGDNRAWDGIWDARVRHSQIGWTIEIEIPFRTLNFDPDNDTWGMNFQRTVRRKNEDSIWNGWARNQGLRRMTNAGHVSGIRDVSQGRGLDIKPYGLLTSQLRTNASGNYMDRDANAGIDFFYNPTPQLRANLTINTDFAQTEVDQRQVNLTRFSLFFPEKRDFFLDGATFFDFGSAGGGDLLVNPFFSRRIGLSAAATPQKIDFGTKVTGQLGAQDVGLLHVRTGSDEDEGVLGEDFTVARVKRRMLRQSYLGALYTRRHTRDASAGDRHTAGLDFRLATSTLFGRQQNFETTAWFLHTRTPGVSSGGNAFGFNMDYPNDRWNADLEVREVQEHFDPAVGFITRRNYRRYFSSLAFGPRPKNHRYIRRLLTGPSLDVQTDLDGRLLLRTLNVTVIEPQLHSQDSFAVGVSTTEERLDANFPISRQITLPAGSRYDYNRYWVRFQSANRRKVALNGRYEVGDFYSGTRDQSILGVTLRMRPGYILALNAEWNDIALAEGRFSTNLFRVIGDTQFTPFMALVNTVQFDTVSRVLGWQSRFRWILKPGNDLYVVFQQNWLENPAIDRFATVDRRAASKLLYTKRF